jgi:hypothetical protein
MFVWNFLFKYIAHLQEPALHHCHLRSYLIVVEEEGNTYVSSVIVSQLPLNVRGLKPYKNYSWTLKYSNSVISAGSVTTLESGKLKHVFTHI